MAVFHSIPLGCAQSPEGTTETIAHQFIGGRQQPLLH